MLALEQFPHWFKSNIPVLAGPNRDIQNLIYTAACALQIHTPSIDLDEHLVEMLGGIGSRSRYSEIVGLGYAELQRRRRKVSYETSMPRSVMRSSTS